jgi:hypothetical protein
MSLLLTVAMVTVPATAVPPSTRQVLASSAFTEAFIDLSSPAL